MRASPTRRAESACPERSSGLLFKARGYWGLAAAWTLLSRHFDSRSVQALAYLVAKPLSDGARRTLRHRLAWPGAESGHGAQRRASLRAELPDLERTPQQSGRELPRLPLEHTAEQRLPAGQCRAPDRASAWLGSASRSPAGLRDPAGRLATARGHRALGGYGALPRRPLLRGHNRRRWHREPDAEQSEQQRAGPRDPRSPAAHPADHDGQGS
jgi:hypothetical protein